MYLVFDTETGGLGREVSLLTAYFAVFDKQFNFIDELDLKLIPDDGIYKVQPTALEINKIDLKELAKEAITYKVAKTVLYKFLEWNFIKIEGGGKFIPVGQAVNFDTDGIVDTIIGKGSWDNFVSRRAIDTMPIAMFLKDSGIIQTDSVSLASLVEYFKVEVGGEPHTARADALRTIGGYQKMIELVTRPVLKPSSWDW